MAKFFTRLFFIALLIAAVVFAPNLIGEQGYILISLGLWTVEGTIVEFVALILVSLLIIWAVIKAVSYVFLMLIWPSKWWQKFHAKTHANYYQQGLNLMALGQWRLAAEQFLRVRRSEKIESARALSLVCAAQAKHQDIADQVKKQLDIEDLNLASSPYRVDFAELVILSQNKDYSSALALLDKLALPVLKQTAAFQQLWLEINIYSHNWREVDEHLPKINKALQREFSESAYNEWQATLQGWFERSFAEFVRSSSLNKLSEAWQTLHKQNRQLPAVKFAYLTALAEAKQSDKIESLILEQKKGIDNAFILAVVRKYYELNHQVRMDKLFHRVHQQATKSPNDKTLLTVMAYLAAGQKDHQLAKQALQQVIYSQPHPTDIKLFAQELALLGETQKSLEMYHSL